MPVKVSAAEGSWSSKVSAGLDMQRCAFGGCAGGKVVGRVQDTCAGQTALVAVPLGLCK